jgi:lysophospholipase L1-like esterase
MKPFYSFLFALGVFGALFIISLLIPEKGIPLANGDTINFPQYTDLLYKDTNQYKDITYIIEETEIFTDTIPPLTHDSISDSISDVKNETVVEKVVQTIIGASEVELKNNIQKIEFSEGNEKILHPLYYAMINAKLNNELIRILHYGDSQIEGDRISSYIRNQLQSKFGGSGVGLLPPVQQYNYQISIKHYTSNNWYRYTNFPHSNSAINHKRYGLMASFCRFSPYQVDTLIDDEKNYEAWISLEKSMLTYRLARKFQQCRIFYGHNHRPLVNEVLVNDEVYDADILEPSNSLQTKTWHFENAPDKLTLKFKGPDSPDFYAIALDDYSGVAVDNIPMRGSAGLFFSKTDQQLYRQLLHALNVKMVILQFGGNVVPYIQDYGFYERLFYAQLMTIKSAKPGIPVLVIGVADMSVNKNGAYVTHHSVEKVRDALKKATFQAGCGYWDMYEAMGGRNSMPGWVFAKPPLAAKDFVHFNRRGAKLVAEMFYSALMFEYNNYITNGQTNVE